MTCSFVIWSNFHNLVDLPANFPRPQVQEGRKIPAYVIISSASEAKKGTLLFIWFSITCIQSLVKIITENVSSLSFQN